MNLFCNIFFGNLDLAFLELIEQIEPSGWGLWFDAHSAVVCVMALLEGNDKLNGVA